ncbi:MAG: hypothetical protein WDN72_00515 [Alphaproteobacteria bacterium]
MNATPTKKAAPVRSPTARAEKDLESFRDIADDVIESDFVPYACLYDADTIATKNGELVQILRITGLSYDAQGQGDLREAIRQAIRQCIPDASYAVWLHTLRRRKSLAGQAEFPTRSRARSTRATAARTRRRRRSSMSFTSPSSRRRSRRTWAACRR